MSLKSKPRLFYRSGLWYCGLRGYGRVGAGHDIFHAYVEWSIKQ